MTRRLRGLGPVLAGLALATLLPAAAAAQDATQLEQACDTGDAAACSTLGLLHEVGGDVPKDLERAAALYERACGGGVPAACHSLALLYESGSGVNRDFDRAVELYRAACEGSRSQACDRLATMGQTGAVAQSALQFPRWGRITDARTGAPLPETIVEVAALGIRAVSDESGRVSLGRLAAGRYPVRAERFGYQVVGGEIVVPAEDDFEIRLPRADLLDPTAPGRIAGRIFDQGGGDALSNVEVAVHDASGLRTLTDAQGRFVLGDLEPGLIEIGLARLGYAPRTIEVVVQPGGTVELSASMSSEAIELDPIEVTVQSAWLDRNGFYRREQRGLGSHFTRQDLEAMNLVWLSDLAWRVPGVQARFERNGEAMLVSRRYGTCTLGVFIDGVPARYKGFDDLDDILPHWLEGVEVYHGIETPIEYGGMESCGAVVLWTQR